MEKKIGSWKNTGNSDQTSRFTAVDGHQTYSNYNLLVISFYFILNLKFTRKIQFSHIITLHKNSSHVDYLFSQYTHK